MSLMTLHEDKLDAWPDLPMDRPLTVEDLERTPDDGRKYELADGRLDVTAAAAQPHVRAESRLIWLLTAVAPRGEFEVQTDPGMTIKTKPARHRIPDIVVRKAEPLPEGNLTRPPLLAIEVVSPESVFRDNHTKRREYAKFGIPAYWVINPSLDKPGIIEFQLTDGQYREIRQTFGTEVFRTDIPFPVTIVPEWLIADGMWMDYITGPLG